MEAVDYIVEAIKKDKRIDKRFKERIRNGRIE